MPYPTSGSKGSHLDQNSAGTESTPGTSFLSSWVFQAQALTSLEQHQGNLAYLLSGLITSAAGNTCAFAHFCMCANRHMSLCM